MWYSLIDNPPLMYTIILLKTDKGVVHKGSFNNNNEFIVAKSLVSIGLKLTYQWKPIQHD